MSIYVKIIKSFGNFVLNTEFEAGNEILALLGSSGSGKSMTLKCIAGIVKPDKGRIVVDGVTLFDSDKKINLSPQERHVGLLFQNYALFPNMTVEQNLYTVLKNCNGQKNTKERLDLLLESFYLTGLEKHYPGQLSGGQQQRVALARALVAQPSLLLLDEPLSNLDAKLRESMRFEISGIQKKLGITVIYVTHDQSEAMTMSDRIVVMSMGKVQQIGRPYDIYTHPVNQMVADFIGLVNFIPAEAKGDRVFIKGHESLSFPNTKNLSGEAILAVRPENIKMSKSGGMVEGVMHHRFYMGDSVDYRVKVKDHFIRVIQKGAVYGTYADGETVYLDFDNVMTFAKEE